MLSHMSLYADESPTRRQRGSGVGSRMGQAPDDDPFYRGSQGYGASDDSGSHAPEFDDNISYGGSFYGDANAAVRQRRPWGSGRKPRPITVEWGEPGGGGPEPEDTHSSRSSTGPIVEEPVVQNRASRASDEVERRAGAPGFSDVKVDRPMVPAEVDERFAGEDNGMGRAAGFESVRGSISSVKGALPQGRAQSAPLQEPAAKWGEPVGEGPEPEDTHASRPYNGRIVEEPVVQDRASQASDEGERPAAAPGLSDVEVDRPMVPAEMNERFAGEENGMGRAAGIGKLGGVRGKVHQLKKNPLYMFPVRAAKAGWGLAKTVGKLAKRGWSWLKGKFAKSQPAGAAAGADLGDGDPEAKAPAPPPTIQVDPATQYGQHVIAKAESRRGLAEYQARNPDGEVPENVPQGWQDTKFGNAKSMLWRMRQGGPVGSDERDYLRAMQSKAVAIDKQATDVSSKNTSAFPFSQRAQADEEDTAAAKAGHFATAMGAAINDREELRPDEKTNAAGAHAWDALNVTANLGKAGTKFVDKQIKKLGFDDEKVLGQTGKAYLETGKAAQFTGWVAKDIATGVDAAEGGTAGQDFMKKFNPLTGMKNLDRIAKIGTDLPIPNTDADGNVLGPQLRYEKNVNVLTAGKIVENPMNMLQAAGIATTEAAGRPFQKMHDKRAELLQRQFVTTVARRKLQADRANRDGLLNGAVDDERRGFETFRGANTDLLRAAAGEQIAAQNLGKEAQQSGYASNYGLDMDKTAALNDKVHQRRYGKEFHAAQSKNANIAGQPEMKSRLKASLGTNEEDKAKRDTAARLLGQKWFKHKAWGKAGKQEESNAAVDRFQAMSEDDIAAGRVDAGGMKAVSPLQWKDRTARKDEANQEKWRGLWNDRPEMSRAEAKNQVEAGQQGEGSEGAELVDGRAVRRRRRAGRFAAGLAQGLGKTLDVTGGVIGFDNGEQDLKEGNLKTAGAKAAMSEVYQNGMTAGLGYIPVVGKYAKTIGLAALTPAGETLKMAGRGLEELAFGKEVRDRDYNQHWGLENPDATDATRDRRKGLRETENAQAAGLASAADKPAALKQVYLQHAKDLKELESQPEPDQDEITRKREAAEAARKAVLDQTQKLRETEQGLGRSRKQELARTGLVMQPRAEAPFNEKQVPLTEQQLAQHRELFPNKLSAAMPKELMVYAPKAKAAKPTETLEQPEQVEQPVHVGPSEAPLPQKEEEEEDSSSEMSFRKRPSSDAQEQRPPKLAEPRGAKPDESAYSAMNLDYYYGDLEAYEKGEG